MPKLHGSNSFLEWRIQTQSVDHCPLRKPLWMSHAGMLGTKCASEPAKANENWPWTQIPSEERWQTWQKGKIWHTLVFTGDQTALGKDTHTEKPLLQFETPPTEHVTLLLLTAGSYSLMSFLTTNSLSNCFFFYFFFLSVSPVYLPVIWSPLKGCFSSLSPLAISALKGSLQLEGKKTRQRIFQLNCQKLAVLINPAQWKGREPFVKWPHPWRSAWVLPSEPCLPEPASPR